VDLSGAARTLRAFAWLRWRTLLNALERSSSRDAFERFSIAAEQLVPAVALLVMLPSAAALAGLGAYVGWSLGGTDAEHALFGLLRVLLFAGCVLAILAPVLMSVGGQVNAVRLLLLPIPRAVLYLTQLVSVLADPWMLLIAALVVALPVGLAAAGQVSAALFAAAAGALLLLVLVGTAFAATATVHLIVRNRRRGELFTLIVFLILPAVGLLPGLLDDDDEHDSTRIARDARIRAAWNTGSERVLPLVPSETYATTVRALARSDHRVSARSALVLVVMTVVVHGLAFAAFTRVLRSPGMTTRTGAASSPMWTERRLPGQSAAASAVAMNQLRLALRTPRGRSIMLSPLIAFVVFGAMMWSRSGNPFDVEAVPPGVMVAAMTSFVSLLAIVPFAMNQFAIDRSGLTLMFLSPLETRALLAGKALGNAAIALVPATVGTLGALSLYPGGPAALWLAVPLSSIAAYLLVAPVAAVVSAAFPRAVDLNSVSRGSNAHGLASLLGAVACFAAAIPCILLVVIATMLERPVLAPVLLIGWVLVCSAACAVLLRVAAAVVERRREMLGLAV
jgi:hypothetical protein